MLQELAIERPKVSTNGRMVRHSKLSVHYEALLRQIQAANGKVSTSRAIGVISCAPRAGVTTVAFNIAVTAAGSDCGPVLFIDADLSKLPPRYVLDKAPSHGLSDVLTDAVEPLDCAESSAFENLSVVSGRGKGQSHLSGIAPTKFAELMNEYKRHFNLLIVDIPAPTELNGSFAVAGRLDDIVLVIEAERAEGRVALQAKQKLIDAGANVMGVVFNRRRQYMPRWLNRLI